MKQTYLELPPFDSKTGDLNVIIETPKGSRNKYAYDEDTGLVRFKKLLPQGMVYPFDFGFIPSTKAGDGDPLDVLLLSQEALFPGCFVKARLLGALKAEQREGGKTNRNDRLIAEGRPVNTSAAEVLKMLYLLIDAIIHPLHFTECDTSTHENRVGDPVLTKQNKNV